MRSKLMMLCRVCFSENATSSRTVWVGKDQGRDYACNRLLGHWKSRLTLMHTFHRNELFFSNQSCLWLLLQAISSENFIWVMTNGSANSIPYHSVKIDQWLTSSPLKALIRLYGMLRLTYALAGRTYIMSFSFHGKDQIHQWLTITHCMWYKIKEHMFT